MAENKSLCLALGMQLDVPVADQPELLKNAGFDRFAFDREKRGTSELTELLMKKAEILNLACEYIHAPFYGMDDIWHDESGELAEIMLRDLYATIDDCSNYSVKYAVFHAIIGMDNFTPTQLGLERLDDVVDYAVKKNVYLAFENTEGEMYLEAVMDRYKDVSNVGFCFDSGHELCYNYGKDILSKYCDRLFVTHLNDNRGMTGGELTFYDDSHLLPFDGIADWDGIAKRIKNGNYSGTLSFEVISKGRPTRTDNDIYKGLTAQEYVNKAYSKAVEFRDILKSI
ncbi:MAG: sugar phosphate isomerase/epimerase [Clostridia bacterium]|nr:sugar phosphate isomerase/epimerase [Clostridia bacterium]